MTDRFGNGQTVFAHAVEMQLDGLTNLLFRLFLSFPRRDAAWKVRDISRVVVLCLLDDNGIADGVFFISSDLPV